ncbi:Phenylalanine--tRNA ligase alpha subunit [Babesia sp. Xinjiang]|uniref:Phenylalanine--tRNA ligase alpha subunit n=1 Tax=Babesia sp. Xinjiang TaxID=462227 RepID=UPI000A23A1FC|nr:Phenylalanine--tRNA ligase alpha subunit [Babesia sp. Xinjiang]ORM40017.1 Phenylalanine--tRNA ligase alpha subunit [Babesia sp. Xinjiang]
MCTKEDDLLWLLKVIDAALPAGGPAEASVSTLTLAPGKDHAKAVNGAKSLMAKGYVTLEECKNRRYVLTAEGSQYAAQGSPEFLLVETVRAAKEPLTLEQATATIPNAEHGLKKAMRASLLRIGAGKQLSLGPAAETQRDDITQKLLQLVERCGDSEKTMLEAMSALIADAKKLNSELDDLKKRKLTESHVEVSYLVRKTDRFRCEIVQQVTDLTQELLQERKTWSAEDMKPYNFFSSGKRIPRGALHPLTRTMRHFREIFTSMGFEELDTANYVESSFWCFDALYIPQQHPARDSQDTFFTRVPELHDETRLNRAYIDAVAEAHGDARRYGSTGWMYNWKIEESRKLVLRTHTTACTARLLKRMAENFDSYKHRLPCKFFSIDRVFRNENMDATHLCEFNQVEGVMVGFGLGMGHLIGVLASFYAAIGIEKLRYKPAYNPYTEPSMEIYGYHPELKKWVEIGNSGIFRPEMLLPMGLPPGISVVGWGLSLERPTMISHNIRNIRDLVGCNY